jgi:hypothetical protein
MPVRELPQPRNSHLRDILLSRMQNHAARRGKDAIQEWFGLKYSNQWQQESKHLARVTIHWQATLGIELRQEGPRDREILNVGGFSSRLPLTTRVSKRFYSSTWELGAV